MTRDEVTKRLLDEKPGVPWSTTGPWENALCLGEIDGKWSIYTYERGRIFVDESFDSEEEACDQFYKEICEDAEYREKNGYWAR